jgi:hypothetical protein
MRRCAPPWSRSSEADSSAAIYRAKAPFIRRWRFLYSLRACAVRSPRRGGRRRTARLMWRSHAAPYRHHRPGHPGRHRWRIRHPRGPGTDRCRYGRSHLDRSGWVGSHPGADRIAYGILSLVLAYGFWTLQPCAWTLGVGLEVAGIVINVLQYINNTSAIGGTIFSIAINAIVLWYLYQPNVKAAFGRT